MNTSTSQKLRIGLFSVVGILLLVAGVFFIGAKKNLFSSTFDVYGIFKNTGGLQVGNNVQFGGVNVGTVEKITILSDTVIRVDMVIQTKMREFIKADAVASVGSDGLMGDKLLSIAPGSPVAPKLNDNDQIRTAEPMDYAEVIGRFANVASNAEVITGALADMAVQIKSGNGSIARLVYKDDLARGLEGTMMNAQNITGSLQGIATHIQAGQGSLGELVYTNNLSRRLDSTVSTANYALATVQVAANNFSENMRALQGNVFFRGYFKKKARAEADSLKNAQEEADDRNDMSDDELLQIRQQADQEIQRRQQQRTPPPPTTTQPAPKGRVGERTGR